MFFSIDLERRASEDLDPASTSSLFEDREIKTLRDRIAKKCGIVMSWNDCVEDFYFLLMVKMVEG